MTETTMLTGAELSRALNRQGSWAARLIRSGLVPDLRPPGRRQTGGKPCELRFDRAGIIVAAVCDELSQAHYKNWSDQSLYLRERLAAAVRAWPHARWIAVAVDGRATPCETAEEAVGALDGGPGSIIPAERMLARALEAARA